MSFLGMGTVEILIVLLIAFIFLGPERMVDVARKLGGIVAEMRRMAADLPNLTLDDDEVRRAESPIIHRGGGPNPQTPQSGKDEASALEPDEGETETAEEETPRQDDAPVPHPRVNRSKVVAQPKATTPKEQQDDE